MQLPDIEKLRRFSLASGLVLITYFVAIVKPSSTVSFSAFGVIFNILNPKYISVGFILASIYGLIRFTLYGIIIGRSPSKERKHLLLAAKPVGDAYEIIVKSKEDVDDVRKKLEYAFPSISRDSAGIEIKELLNVGRGINVSYGVRYKPTRRTKFFEILHNIDYMAPIWVNIVALIIAGYSLYTG